MLGEPRAVGGGTGWGSGHSSRPSIWMGCQPRTVVGALGWACTWVSGGPAEAKVGAAERADAGSRGPKDLRPIRGTVSGGLKGGTVRGCHKVDPRQGQGPGSSRLGAGRRPGAGLWAAFLPMKRGLFPPSLLWTSNFVRYSKNGLLEK